MYNKTEVVDFGKALGNLVTAVMDGVGADDIDEAIAVVKAGASVVNEMKDVPAAAGLHTLGAAADVVGDKFQADAEAAEPPPAETQPENEPGGSTE